MGFAGIHGAGLGLRAEISHDVLSLPEKKIDFLELAPENWMQMGGWRAAHLKAIAESYPLIAHGLSLSIGSPVPLDFEFIDQLAHFFATYQIKHYSEHLSFCSDSQGYLHELLPIPFTEEAVEYVSARIKVVQKRLGRQIAFENSSYYYAPGQTLSELEFIKAVLQRADCLMLLDVNNVYVNSVNHHYDPYRFIEHLPGARIAYIHIAGHWQKEADLIIDTHGAAVADPVWQLLQHTYRCHDILPTLLERDVDIPPLPTLLAEMHMIRDCQIKDMA